MAELDRKVLLATPGVHLCRVAKSASAWIDRRRQKLGAAIFVARKDHGYRIRRPRKALERDAEGRAMAFPRCIHAGERGDIAGSWSAGVLARGGAANNGEPAPRCRLSFRPWGCARVHAQRDASTRVLTLTELAESASQFDQSAVN